MSGILTVTSHLQFPIDSVSISCIRKKKSVVSGQSIEIITLMNEIEYFFFNIAFKIHFLYTEKPQKKKTNKI